MQDYRKLIVWQKSHSLSLDVYKVTKGYPKEESYGVTSQIRRAAVSISANIVEGAGRKSKADFARFLTIALGSANEVEYFLLLSKDLEYLTLKKYDSLTQQLIEVRKMLISLEKTITRNLIQ